MPGTADPTVTYVTAAPSLLAHKTATAGGGRPDGDGAASPGDTLLYLVTITNAGNAPSTSTVFDDMPGPNTTLVVGSVQTSAGTVTQGNGAGDGAVTVAVGTIPGGGASVTVTLPGDHQRLRCPPV